MDTTALISVVDVAVILTGLAALAALKMAPTFARWGFNKIIGFFK